MGARPRGWNRPLIERFWEYVDNSGGPDVCWPWIGPRNDRNYGVLVKAKHVNKATHISLALDGRPLPKGMFACHSCDNPPCVNPAHLWIGTARDNTLDMASKGRGWTGPRTAAHRAKQSASIRAYYAKHPGIDPASLRTHCPQGHPYDAENTWRDKDNHRHCRQCNRDNQSRQRAKTS